MKKILLSLILGFVAYSGFSQPVLNLTDRDTEKKRGIPVSEIRSVNAKGSNAYIVTVDPKQRFYSEEDMDSIESLACDFLIRVTDRATSEEFLVGTDFIQYIEADPTASNKANFIMRTPKQRFTLNESFTAALALLDSLSCGSGGGGGADATTVTDAANGLDITETGNAISIAYDILELANVAVASDDSILVWDASANAYKRVAAGSVGILGADSTNLASADGSVDIAESPSQTFDLSVDENVLRPQIDTNYNVNPSGANAGAFLNVTANGPGVTASYASGVYTISKPTHIQLKAVHLLIVSADVQSGSDGAVTDWVRVVLPTKQNTGITVPIFPIVQKTTIPTSGALSVTNAASVDNDNNPLVGWTGIASGTITCRLSGLSIGGQGFGVTFSGF